MMFLKVTSLAILVTIQVINCSPAPHNEMSILTDLCYADIQLSGENLMMAEKSLKCMIEIMPPEYKKCFMNSYGVSSFPQTWAAYHKIICKSDDFKVKANIVDECNANVIETIGSEKWFKIVHDIAKCSSRDY